MTISEFKHSIAESPNKDWYQKYELSIHYQHINYQTTIKGVVGVYSFICEQADGFSSLGKLPQEIEEVRLVFINAKGAVLELFRKNIVNKHSWDTNLSHIAGNGRPPVFLFDSPEAKFLLEVNRDKNEYFLGAYEYLIGSISNPSNKNRLSGYILAYEFSNKDESAIFKRIEKEKASIAELRSSYSEKISKAENEAIEFIKKTNLKFVEFSEKVDELKEEKEKGYNKWFEKTTSDFKTFDDASKKRINELEVLYNEKLKLEAPATYWRERAKKLKHEGTSWLYGLIVCTLISIGILIIVLSKIADGTIQKVFLETGTAVKWSIAFITLISFMAYGIRVFSKLTFSSFHLVRDAEEREQLTYVYLALKNEKTIDQTERHLIMQSLFSRADTGLLKDDASPTMPGNIVDQITKKQN